MRDQDRVQCSGPLLLGQFFVGAAFRWFHVRLRPVAQTHAFSGFFLFVVPFMRVDGFVFRRRDRLDVGKVRHREYSCSKLRGQKTYQNIW